MSPQVSVAAADNILRAEGMPLEVRGLTTVRDRIGARGAGGGGWYIKRDNPDRLRLWRRLGEDGYYADHILSTPQIGTTPGASTNGGNRRATCLVDMGVGRLMKFVPLNLATYTGTWVGISTYWAGTVPDVTEGVDTLTATVTTTAGSTALTAISPALESPSTRWTQRRIVIPGAGASGADYVGALVNTNGTSATLSPAAATAVSGVTATIYGKRHFAAHTSTASYTAPIGADSLGIVYGVAANGGIWTVSVDGDLTRADALPTAQDLVDRGVAPGTIPTTGGGTIAPTTRVIDFFNLTETQTLWQAVATDLDPTVAHTVLLSSTAEKQTGSNNTRSMIAGFGYGTASTTPATPGVSVYYTTRVSPTFPTHELAVDHQPTGATGHAFAGGSNHGYEYGAAPTITVDGSTVTLETGEVIGVGQFASVTVTSSLYHPEVTGSPTFAVKRTYRLEPQGLTVRQVLTTQIATVLTSAYLAMFSVDGALDRAQLDKTAGTLDLNDYDEHPIDTYMNAGNNTAAAWWDADGKVSAAILVPMAQQISAGWSDPGGVKATVRQFRGSSKFYLRRTGTLAIGDVLESEATYVLAYHPDGAATTLPVS